MGQLVEAAKELVEQPDQLLGAALGGEDREADDVRKEDAHVLVLLDVDAMELAGHRREDVVLHLHGHVLGQDGEEQPLQLLVLVLDLQPGGNAIAGVEEGASLGPLHHYIDHQPGHVHADEDDDVGNQLVVLQVPQGVRKDLVHRQADVHRGQGDPEGHRLPDLQRHHCIGQEDHEHDLPDALGHHLLGVHREDAAQGGHRHHTDTGGEEQDAVAEGRQVVVLDHGALQQDQDHCEQHAHDGIENVLCEVEIVMVLVLRVRRSFFLGVL